MRHHLLFSASVLCLIAAAQVAYGSCPSGVSSNTSTSASFCNTSTLTIENNANGPTDGSPYPFQITASGMSGAISSVSVTLNGYTSASGTPPEDAALMLVSPDGNHALTFFGGDCGGGENAQNGLNITLSDSGSSVPPNTGYNAACASTTYKPDVVESDIGGSCPSSAFGNGAPASAPCANNPSSNTFTSVFTGATANGTWKVYAYDVSGTDVQSINNGITLTITTEVTESATTTSLGVSPGEIFNSSSNNSSMFTATVTSSGNPVTEGEVQFYDNGATAGTPIAVNGSGVAQLNDIYGSATPEGVHDITAVYTDTATNPKYETSNNNSNPTLLFIDNQTVVSNSNTTFCNPGTITILGSGTEYTSPYPQHVFVSGLSGSVAGITLTLNNINTSYGLTDWKVLLVGPDGKSFVPMAFSGGYKSESGLTLNLSDSGSGLLAPGSSNTTPANNGTYQPTAYGTYTWPTQNEGPFAPPQSGYLYPQTVSTGTFSATFGSENINNATAPWSLYIADEDGDSDTVGGYCLSFTVNSGAATATSVSSNTNPDITNTQIILTAHVTSGGVNVTGGSVKFEQQGNPTPLGTANVDGNGNATLNFTPSTEGQYTITALYTGASGTYNPSQGSFTLQVDNQTSTTNNGNNNYSVCNAGPITITASTNHTPQQYPSRVDVTGLAGLVSGVTLTLDSVTYSYAQDLAMMIAGPSSSNNIVFWSNVGGDGAISGQSYTIADGSSALPQNSTPVSGTYAPTDYSTPYTVTFPAPAPASPNAAGNTTLGAQFDGTNPDGYWSFYVVEPSAGGDTGSIGEHCVNITVTPPALSITKHHSGNFTQGDTADTYTITVTNNGPGSTAGTLNLTDTLPAGMSAVSMSETANTGGGTGSDWSCSGTTCTRTTPMPSGESDTITLTVSVGYSTATGTNAVTNSVSVSGGGISATQTANDPTTINPGPVQVTFSTSPSGLSYSVQIGAGPVNNYSSQTVLSIPDGSTVTVSTAATQSPSTGTQDTFSSWSGGNNPSSASQTITVSSTTGTASYTANFNTYYLLTTAVNQSAYGSVGVSSSATPSNGYYPAGATVTLTATPASSGYVFQNWTGTSNTSTNPLMVTMNSPVSETANFALNNVNVTISTSPTGLLVSVDGATAQAAPVQATWQVGSSHTIATTSPQGSSGTRYTFTSWSDNGSISHQVNASSSVTSYTATFGASYLLTTSVNPSGSGTVTPGTASPTGDGYYPAATVVSLTASPSPAYAFTSWSGGPNLSSTSTNPTNVTMNGPESVTANFMLTYATIGGQVSVTENGLLFSTLLANPGAPGSPGGGTTTFTITNTSGSAITGPIQLVLNSLPAGVTGANNTGTFNGSPYWAVPNSGSLAAGSSLTVVVQLNYAASTAVSTTPAVYTGSL